MRALELFSRLGRGLPLSSTVLNLCRQDWANKAKLHFEKFLLILATFGKNNFPWRFRWLGVSTRASIGPSKRAILEEIRRQTTSGSILYLTVSDCISKMPRVYLKNFPGAAGEREIRRFFQKVIFNHYKNYLQREFRQLRVNWPITCYV